MRKWFLPGLLLVVSIQAIAADPTPAQEIAAHSTYPLSDVQAKLATCDSNVQANRDAFFCAWRDLVVAQRELQQIVDQRNSQDPKHKVALDARIASWKKARAVDCQKKLDKGLADGSLDLTALPICEARETQDMVQAMRKDHTAIPCKQGTHVCHDDLPDLVAIPAFTADQELATRSKLPLSDIQEMLASCDSYSQSTQGMYFCAWRDLIVAEHELQQIVDQRNSQYPKRKAALDEGITRWKKARAADCQKEAHQDWAGGSMEPVAALSCQAGETQDMVKAMRKDPTAIPCKSGVKICHQDARSQ